MGVLGVLRETLPTAAAHHGAHADLAASSWLPVHKALHRSHLKTSFSDAQITTCQEGFRCVSRVNRFGTDHTKEVLRDKARQAQAQNTADESGDGKEEGGEKGGAKDEPKIEEYEWNCPVQSNWVADRFESGVEADQCREEKDCICVARGAEDSFTELKDGLEKRHETVEAEVGCGGGKTQKIPIVIIPHYPIRRVSESFDPMNINSDMGGVTELPSGEYVGAYKNSAPKLQFAMDSLKKWLAEQYDTKVADKPFVCGPPVPGQVATMSDADVHEASVKIRNFQVLQKDCEMMRDQVPLLISPTSEKVSPPGQSFMGSGKKLNCYKQKNGDICVQLNCYSGHDDAVFRDHVREFEARMMACEPEPEDVNPAPGDTSPTTATEANPAPGAGVVAGGQAPPPNQQGVGLGAAAVAALLSPSNHGAYGTAGASTSASSKRNNWRRFL